MNLKPYVPAIVPFVGALLLLIPAYTEYVAASVPGAVVPLAVGGVPASSLGLLLLAVVGAAVGVWNLPRSVPVPSRSPSEVSEWCANLAADFARRGDKEGLGLVTTLAVHCAGKGAGK